MDKDPEFFSAPQVLQWLLENGYICDDFDKQMGICDEGQTCNCRSTYLTFHRTVAEHGGVWVHYWRGKASRLEWQDDYESRLGAP